MNLEEQYDRLLRYCYALTRNRAMAEDITQEAFLRFWQSRGYREQGKAMAYLYTIARNLCMDEFRRQRGRDYAVPEEAPGPDSPEDILTALDVERALDVLPGELREMVLLRYTVGLSAAQIGQMLGISRFAVHRRLKEALSLLKTALQEADSDE